MEHFVARQPIFDRKKNVVAYELLFRSGLANYFDHVDGDEASSRVITDSFLLFGVEEMTGGGKAFINFTRRLLVGNFALALPKEWIVVEVLETVEPDQEVLAACRQLKQNGFALALDDFVYDPKYEALLEVADIVKIDFLATDAAGRQSLASRFLPRGLKLLAEKVETNEDFRQALDLGYSYFQGYFFSKPVIISRKDVPAFKMQYMRIMREISQPEMDFRQLAKLIEGEVSLSFKLLKYINSAAFGLSRKVQSIKQAVNYLGESEIKKWSTIMTLAAMASDKPSELVISSFIRGRFCQSVAPAAGHADRAGDLFLMGLFSMLDAIMDRPLAEVLAEMPLDDNIKSALLGSRNPWGRILELTLAFERGEWADVASHAMALGLDESVLPEAYIRAIQDARQVFAF